MRIPFISDWLDRRRAAEDAAWEEISRRDMEGRLALVKVFVAEMNAGRFTREEAIFFFSKYDEKRAEILRKELGME